MNQIIEFVKLDSEELVKRRDKAMEEKQEYRVTLKSVAPYRIKQDAKVQIELCETQINKINDELERRAIALGNKNKTKNEGVKHAEIN